MDIWIARVNKVSSKGEPILCEYCHQPFSLGSYAVFGSMIVRNKDGVICWSKILHWHTKLADGSSCYIEQGIAAAAKRPYVENRGRKRNLLSPEVRKVRLKILMRRAHLIQELSNLMECLAVGEDVIDKVASCGEKLENLKVQISAYGGVPPSWESGQSVKEDSNGNSPLCEEALPETSERSLIHNSG
jgi:hypothetical protein